jgi:hypothetical protein
MGMLYRRGRVWWTKWYVDGRPMRESTGIATDDDTIPSEARRFLKVREGNASGEPVLRRVDRIRYEEIREDLLEHTTRRRAGAAPRSSAGASSTWITSSEAGASRTSRRRS